MCTARQTTRAIVIAPGLEARLAWIDRVRLRDEARVPWPTSNTPPEASATNLAEIHDTSSMRSRDGDVKSFSVVR